MTVKSETLPIVLKRKLSVIQFEINICFDGHLIQICNNVFQELSAPSRVANYTRINQRKLVCYAGFQFFLKLDIVH